LPNLEKLDDKVVLPEEVQTAMTISRPLIHPLEMDASPQSDAVTPEVRTDSFLSLFFFFRNNIITKKMVNGKMLSYCTFSHAFNIYTILSINLCFLYALHLAINSCIFNCY